MRKLLYVLTVIGLVACNGNSPGTTEKQQKVEKTVTHDDIEKMSSRLFADGESYSDSLATKLLDAFMTFRKENPEDKMTPEYLFNGANVAKRLKNYNQCIEMYEDILQNYPTYEKVIESHFLIAFIYDNDLKNKDKAAEVYKEVAEKYPDEKFGQDAAGLLKTVHMTDEELYEWLDAQNK